MRPQLHRAMRLVPAPQGAPLMSSLAIAAMLAACGGAEQADPDSQAASAQPAAAAANAICFYEHVNYQGATFCASADSSWIGSAWNDRVSSVKVTAGYKVQLFEHINAGGRSLTLSADTPNLVSVGFNDAASSYKVTAPVAPPTPPSTPTKVAGIQLAQTHLFNSDDSALVLVANNPYVIDPRPQHGTRGDIDAGVLGIIAVTGPPPGGLTEWSTPTFRVDSATAVALGIDGESVAMEPPLVFESDPRKLRVLVPARRRLRRPAGRPPRPAKGRAVRPGDQP